MEIRKRQISDNSRFYATIFKCACTGYKLTIDMEVQSGKILMELVKKGSELSTVLNTNLDCANEVKYNANSSLGSLIENANLPIPANARTSMSNLRRQFLSSGGYQKPRAKSLRSKEENKNITKGPFLRNIIFLPGLDVDIVPRQGKRVFLIERGYAYHISGFQMQKEWSETEVETNIREAFIDMLP